MRRTLILLALTIVASACSGGGGATPAPPSAATPPPTTGAAPPTVVAAPPGQVMVTVAAASTPPGATVTGGGQVLGTTPFTSQVPVPAPNPGETQTFQFTFTLPGYQPTTLTASPVNNTISLNAVLASAMPAVPPPTGGTLPPTTGGGTMRVHGIGGGPIFDYHTTTATANVGSPCVIRALHVSLDGRHTFPRDLEVTLRGPDGETYSLQRHSSRSPFRSHSVTRARGHLAMGLWTVSIADTVGADGGALTGFDMELECM